MFTSRAEFRLHLRIDNADRRLTPHGRRIGLISDSAWTDYLAKQQRMESLKQLLERTRLTPAMIEKITHAHVGTDAPVRPAEQSSAGGFLNADLASAAGQTCAQLLKRPEVTIENLVLILRDLSPELFSEEQATLSSSLRNELKSVETEIKYEGYLLQQDRAIQRLKKAEQRAIPEWFDYAAVSGLSREMQETLLKVRPRTLAHASRIPGVTPAAVSLVNVFIEIQGKRRELAATL
jgi:tRNA uridine 5-carboxymethylaminomethyl modification enzyme